MTEIGATARAQLMKLKAHCALVWVVLSNLSDELCWDFLYWQHNGFSVMENTALFITMGKEKKKGKTSPGLKEIYELL